MDRSPLAAKPGKSNTVQELVQQSQQRQAQAGKDGRGRAAHGGKLGQDGAGRAKMTVKIPLALQEQAREIAKKEDTFPADVVALAIARLYKDWKGGVVDLHPLKIPANSPKVSWRLDDRQF